jgi:hypothetical protein
MIIGPEDKATTITLGLDSSALPLLKKTKA